MESATILTPPSTSLSGLLSVPEDQNMKSLMQTLIQDFFHEDDVISLFMYGYIF